MRQARGINPRLRTRAVVGSPGGVPLHHGTAPGCPV